MHTKADDGIAFANALSKVAPSAKRFLARRLRSREDVEDCFQETAIIAYRKWGVFDGNRSKQAWFLRIAHYCVQKHNRFKHQAKRSPPGGVELLSLDPSNTSTDCGDSLSDEETVWHVTSALLALDPVKQQAIRLHYFGGLTFAEVAETLGCSISHACKLCHAAIKELRSRLGDGIVCESTPNAEQLRNLDPIALSGTVLDRFEITRTSSGILTPAYDGLFLAAENSSLDRSLKADSYYVVSLKGLLPRDISEFAIEYAIKQYRLRHIWKRRFSRNFHKTGCHLDTAIWSAQRNLSNSSVSSRIQYAPPVTARLGGLYDFVVVAVSTGNSLLVIRRLLGC